MAEQAALALRDFQRDTREPSPAFGAWSDAQPEYSMQAPWRHQERALGALSDRIAASSLSGSEDAPQFKGRVTGPIQVLAKIARQWRLTDRELADLLAYPDDRTAVDLLNGRVTLRDPDKEDRLRLVFGIHQMLKRLFADPEMEIRWLRLPNPKLADKAPLEIMTHDRIPGMIAIRSLVERLAGR